MHAQDVINGIGYRRVNALHFIEAQVRQVDAPRLGRARHRMAPGDGVVAGGPAQNKALVAVEELGVGFKLSAPFPDGELDGRLRVVPWEELMAEPVTRVTIRSPESTSAEFDELIDQIGLHEVSYAVGWSAWLDINPEGVSKGSALEQLRRQLGVQPGDTVAVGDQRNDLEMLDWAARGVAMGQAPAEVLAAADEVTGHVDDHSLAQVLRSLEGVEAVLAR